MSDHNYPDEEFDYETTFGLTYEELLEEEEFCHSCKRAYGRDVRDVGSGLMYECPNCGNRWIVDNNPPEEPEQ